MLFQWKSFVRGGSDRVKFRIVDGFVLFILQKSGRMTWGASTSHLQAVARYLPIPTNGEEILCFSQSDLEACAMFTTIMSYLPEVETTLRKMIQKMDAVHLASASDHEHGMSPFLSYMP